MAGNLFCSLLGVSKGFEHTSHNNMHLEKPIRLATEFPYPMTYRSYLDEIFVGERHSNEPNHFIRIPVIPQLHKYNNCSRPKLFAVAALCFVPINVCCIEILRLICNSSSFYSNAVPSPYPLSEIVPGGVKAGLGASGPPGVGGRSTRFKSVLSANWYYT